MNIKSLLSHIGLGAKNLLGGGKKGRVSPLVREREGFELEMRDQFLKLKEKGLSIHIFTL